MANENIITVTGTVGKEPELRYTPGGQPVTKFSLATNRRWKKKNSDQWDEETTWHNVVVWGELGENVAASLDKGHRAIVQGRLSIRSYEDKMGEKKWSTEIIADNVGVELRFATCEVSRTERQNSTQTRAQPHIESVEEPF